MISVDRQLIEKVIHVQTSESETMIELDEPIYGIREVRVKSVEIPFSWYNVRQDNNCVDFFINGVDYSCQLTPQNYVPSQLATELESKMNDKYPGFTVTYHSQKNKFTISHASEPFIIKWGSGAGSDRSARSLFGFTYYDTDSGLSHDSVNMANLTGENSIYIVSELIGEQVVNKVLHIYEVATGLENVIAKVPIRVPMMSIAMEKLDCVLLTKKHRRYAIDLKLVFDNGKLVDLNGIPWSITLSFMIDPFSDREI